MKVRHFLFNPSYLSLSRHNVFYFRYPVPESLQAEGKASHIKLSLKTREPREALRLARNLAYHAEAITHLSTQQNMTYEEIRDILKDHFYALLDEKRAQIRTSGVLSNEEIEQLRGQRDNPEPANDEIVQDILAKQDKTLKKGSQSYEMLKSQYQAALSGYSAKLLEFDQKQRVFTFSTRPEVLDAKRGQPKKVLPENMLGKAIDDYQLEMHRANAWGIRAKNERASCLALLPEILGESFNLPSLDKEKARFVKDILLKLPLNRMKKKETKHLNIFDQVDVEGVERLSSASINKYLDIMGGFAVWAKGQGFLDDNPFEGLKLKEGKGKKREHFSRDEIALMFEKLRNEPVADYRKWGVLIAAYTGARLNEIASLKPEDIKQENGIWYFDINDEEEKKRLKSDAAKRRVPVHSRLIELGLLDYRDSVQATANEDTRLLSELTYSERDGWGRKLGRWYNDNFLLELGIKKDGLSFHSMRHSVITYLSQAGGAHPIVQTIVGHEKGDITHQVYHHGYTLPQLHEVMELLAY